MKAKVIIETAKLIKELYETEQGSVGGYGHIVFDDDNIETENILWCIEEAKKNKYNYSEETTTASIKALEAMIPLTLKERQKAINHYFNNN